MMSTALIPGKMLRRRKPASQYVEERWGIPCKSSTLAKLAVIGGGPEMIYAGRFPLYSEDALDAWALSKLSAPVRSTSERQSESVKEREGV